MSHPVNEEIKDRAEEEVNTMRCLDLLNFCDDVGIKTSEMPMEELMDQVTYYLYEQKMQP